MKWLEENYTHIHTIDEDGLNLDEAIYIINFLMFFYNPDDAERSKFLNL